MAHAVAVAAAESGDGLTLLSDLGGYLALHADCPVGGVDGLDLDTGLSKEVVDVPMGDPPLSPACSQVSSKPRDQAVQGGTHVDVSPPREVDDSEGADLDL